MPILDLAVARCARTMARRGSVVAVALLSVLVMSTQHSPAHAVGDGATGQTGGGTFPPDSSTTVSPVVTTAYAGSYLSASGALPLARPGGFGGATTGGADGRTIHVTSDADSVSAPQQGTLRWALAQSGPKWIVFDRDMTITFAAGMPVPSDTTIDARWHNVVLTGHGKPGLLIYGVHNVVLENLVLRDFGDVAQTINNDPNDAVDVQNAQDVWIDHCSMSHTGDKLISTEDAVVGMTISNNHFYDQEQTVQIGSMSTAMGDARTTVTMDHNYFDRVGYRLPLVMYAKAHVYNNVMDRWTVSAVRAERTGQIYLERNLFVLAGQSRATSTDPAQICNDKKTLCDSRTGYLADVANTYVGRAKLAPNTASHVFDPHSAYSYTASPAVVAMAATLLKQSGAQTTPLLAALHVQLSGTGSPQGTDHLTITTGTIGSAHALVNVRRKVHGRWHTFGTMRLSSRGTARVAVRDANPRTSNDYLAYVHQSRLTKAGTSAPLRLR